MMFERFVPCPGIIDIVWTSDDPDYYVPPSDLFDIQSRGLGDIELYLQKDKRSTEQAMFTCKLCECELKSIATLRAHCGGTKHIRKALQAKKDYKDKIAKDKKNEMDALVKEVKKEEVTKEYVEFY